MTSRILKDIENYPFEPIVVGAGINGSGIARDAAMRGLRPLLLDKGDISGERKQKEVEAYRWYVQRHPPNEGMKRRKFLNERRINGGHAAIHC